MVLLCTGLGRVNRGFEQHIATLAQIISRNTEYNNRIQVWCGTRWIMEDVKVRRIRNFPRNSWPSNLSATPFIREQQSFFLGMLPYLFDKKSRVFYLGEYRLYCYLSKLRKLFKLKYSLALFTGGFAIPGKKVFDENLDFIHHVTDKYLEECQIYPKEAQKLLPHFVSFDFSLDYALINRIKQLANGKKIILSVGSLDNSYKRLDLLINALSSSPENYFPLLIGPSSHETPVLLNQLKSKFGNGNFYIGEVDHVEMGTFYEVADVFISCTKSESFGLAMVEALSFGLPVICSDSPVSRFVLKENAMLIDINTPNDILNALDNLPGWIAKQNLDELVEFARSYSIENLSPAYFDMFRTIEERQTIRV